LWLDKNDDRIHLFFFLLSENHLFYPAGQRRADKENQKLVKAWGSSGAKWARLQGLTPNSLCLRSMTAVAQRQKLTLTTERNLDEGHSLNRAKTETGPPIDRLHITPCVGHSVDAMIRNDSAFHIQPDESESE
jgi:hypothetical protein